MKAQTTNTANMQTKKTKKKRNVNKRKYPCPQNLLYVICLYGWALCRRFLTEFKNFKAFYSDSHIDDAVKAVGNAKLLTESRQTISARKRARILLVGLTKIVTDNFQLLKSYISTAYSKDLVATMLEEAGASLYAKASIDNWGAVLNLIDTANTFISANIAELTANQNMPAQFQIDFAKAGQDCVNQSTVFFNLETAKELAAKEKIDANNAVYESFLEMLNDGKQVFKSQSALKMQFSVANILAIHRGQGTASLHGYIKDANGLAIPGATIISKNGKYKGTSTKKGRYSIKKVAEGETTFIISAPGYQTVEATVTFKASTESKLNIELAAQLLKVA